MVPYKYTSRTLNSELRYLDGAWKSEADTTCYVLSINILKLTL